MKHPTDVQSTMAWAVTVYVVVPMQLGQNILDSHALQTQGNGSMDFN
jgi:hypothetical protein